MLRAATLITLPISIVLYWASGTAGSVPGSNFQRFYYHVLPIVISTLYGDRTYDRAADFAAVQAVWSQPLELQLDSAISESIKNYLSSEFGGGDYFWQVDDRGFADFALVAFRLFGPRMLSLSIMYFLVLALTVLLFFAAARSSRGTLLLGTMWMATLAMSSPIFLLPTDSVGNLQGFQPILHLTETRFFPVLAILPTIGLAAQFFRNHWDRRALVVAFAQGAVIVLICQVRGTTRIYVVGLVLLVLAILLRRVTSGAGKRQLAVGFVLIGALAVGVSLVAPIVQSQLEHPRYRDFGSRTFWHNALMGFAYSPDLSTKFGLIVSDHASIAFVLAFKDTGNIEAAAARVKSDPAAYEERAQEALNWTTTATSFNWGEHEIQAQRAFWEIVSAYPFEAAETFLVLKPIATWTMVKSKLADFDVGSGLGVRYFILVAIAFALGALAGNPIPARALGLGLLGLAGLLAISLTPSVLFYGGTTQVGETLVLLGAICCTTGVAMGQVVHSVIKRFGQSADPLVT